MRPSAGPPRTDIGVQVGLVVAAAQVPEHLRSRGSPRAATSTRASDHALSTGLHYLLAVGTQDALQAAAAELARTPLAARWADPVTSRRARSRSPPTSPRFPLGLALQRALPVHPGEAMARGGRARPDGARHPPASRH